MNLREGNVFTHVCLSTRGGDVYPSMQWSRQGVVCIPAYTGAGREEGGVYPNKQMNRGAKREVRILLECILVLNIKTKWNKRF